jgi:hypothetical protein
MKAIKIFAVATLCFAAACSNEDLNTNNVLPERSDLVSPYADRMSVIADMSKDYEASLVEALAERNLLKSSSGNDAFDLHASVCTRFAQKSSKYQVASQSVATKSSGEEFIIDADKLQARMDKLGELWDASLAEMVETATMEEFLARMQKNANDLVAEVMSDNSLSAFEQQSIREHIVFRSNVAVTTIKYGEEIAEMDNQPETKGWLLNKLKKAAKIAECTYKSAVALTTCVASGIGTYYTGVNPATIGAWGQCYVNAWNAYNCWRNV